jgi:hypothetical protein
MDKCLVPDDPGCADKDASVRQAKPGLSRKLKGAYPWNNPFIKVAKQALVGVIRVDEALQGKLASRSESEPDSASLS